MSRSKLLIFSTIFIGMFFQASLAQNIYKWLDSEGRTQYTQQEPQRYIRIKSHAIAELTKTELLGIKHPSEAFLVDDGHPTRIFPSEKSIRATKVAAAIQEKTKETEKRLAEKSKEEAEAQKRNCERIIKNQEVFNKYYAGEHPELKVIKNGAEVVLTEEEIDKQYTQNLKEFELHCN